MSARGGPGAGSAVAIPSASSSGESGAATCGSAPKSSDERSGDGGGGGGGDNTSPIQHNRIANQHGHSFLKKTFHRPTNCHYCGELLWGLMGQGYVCEGK